MLIYYQTGFNWLLSKCEKATHHFNIAGDLGLTHSIETERLTIFPEIPSHFLTTFKITIMDYTTVGNRFHYSTCLSESAVTKFKNIVHPLLSFSLPYAIIVQSSYLKAPRLLRPIILLIIFTVYDAGDCSSSKEILCNPQMQT